MKQAATRISRRAALGTTVGLGLGGLTAACGGAAGTSTRVTSSFAAVACEDFWGSIVAQIGGTRLAVTNVIADPAIDPHDYEPKTSDARLFAGARYIVVNGAGYDPWAASCSVRTPCPVEVVLTVADLLGKKGRRQPALLVQPGLSPAGSRSGDGGSHRP